MEADPTSLGIEELLQHASWLSMLARRLVHDPAQAEDLVQETWLLVLRGARPRGPAKPWLARVARNLARDRRRSDLARHARERSLRCTADVPGPEELNAQLEAQHLLVAALRELAEPFRSTVLLHYARGQSCAEIARRQRLPDGTVRWRLKRGLDELRARLDERHGGRRGAWCALLMPLANRSETAAAAAAGATVLSGVLAMNLALKCAAAAAILAAGYLLLDRTGTPPREVDKTGSIAAEPVANVPPPPLEPPPRAADNRVAAAPGPADTVHATRAQEPAGAPAPGLSTVRARLIDPSGAPVVGVELHAATSRSASARSGADGRIELALATVQPVQARFHVASARHARLVAHARVRPGAIVELGDLVLEPGGVVRGRVQDEHGAPVPRARVWVERSGVPRAELGELRAFLSPDHEDLAAQADADGHFELVGVHAGHVRLAAAAAELSADVSDSIEVRAGEESSGVVITLAAGAQDHLRGRVLAPDGAPVPFAEVRYTSRIGLSKGMGSLPADVGGRFSIPARPAERFDLQVLDREERYGGARLEGVTASEGPFTLRLSVARRILVVARASRGGALEATITARDTERGFPLARGRSQGGASLLTVPAVGFKVAVHARGFRTVELGPFDPDDPPERLEVELEALPLVRGRVVAGEAGVEGADVLLFAVSDSRTRHNGFPVRVDPTPVGRATSDGAGVFAAPLSRDGAIYVRVEAEGFAPAEQGPLEVRGVEGMEGLELRLTTGGAVEGRVRMPAGREPAGVVVGFSRGDARAFTLRTDATGHFRAEHLIPGPWQIEVVDTEIVPEADGTSTSTGRWKRIPSNCTVEEGRTTRFDIPLGAAPVGELSGHLTIDGKAPGPWSVLLLDPDRLVDPAETGKTRLDAGGRFHCSVGRPGRMRLLLTALEGDLAGLRLLTEVDVGPGARWELALESGLLDVGTLPPVDGSGMQWWLVGEPREGVFALRLSPEGSVRMPRGRASLVRWHVDLGEDPSAWPATRELVVR